MSTILDGKSLSLSIAKKLAKEIRGIKKKPTLAIVQVGNLLESSSYIRHKKLFAEKIGAKVIHKEFPKNISEKSLILNIEKLNKDKNINGIIVQMPLPKSIDKMKVLEAISPQKDVDGLTSTNQAKIFQGDISGLLPATPKGVMSLLKKYKIPLEGKRALVIGRSLLVGRPMAMMLLRANATVSIAHKKTQDLNNLIKQNDIIIVAVGKAGLVGKEALRTGQVVVDVGTNAIKGPKTLEEGVKRKLVGDVVFAEAKDVVDYISPVPGGVGPMTVASLFQNLIEASK